MKINPATLPDDSTLLKQMLVEAQARFDRETSILLEQIQHLHALLFGRKSEKLPRESKGYAEKYQTKGKKIVMIGICFSSAEKNVTEFIWGESE